MNYYMYLCIELIFYFFSDGCKARAVIIALPMHHDADVIVGWRQLDRSAFPSSRCVCVRITSA